MLLKNIKQLVQVREASTALLRGANMSDLPVIENAYLHCENGKISSFGPMSNCSVADNETLDCTGRMVLPTWVDSHTHLVFAATREEEFLMRLQGKSYEEIAEAGGGILNSAEKMASISFDQLLNDSKRRLQALIKLGTGGIEIKSGYGLSIESELKMLRVIKALKDWSPIPIKATFLGAHAYPLQFRENHEGYIQTIIEEMLPAIRNEELADYIDVFCEKGFFSLEESKRVIEAGKNHGLKPKIHANQLSISGAAELGVKLNAVSVDHLEEIDRSVLNALKNSETIACALPACSFFLGIPFAPGKDLIDHDAALTLASDYNPGSSPTGNMNFVLSLACIKMKLTPEQAINAMTVNAAHSIELEHELGSITEGKRANLIITKEIPGLTYLPYSFGENCIEEVVINGQLV